MLSEFAPDFEPGLAWLGVAPKDILHFGMAADASDTLPLVEALSLNSSKAGEARTFEDQGSAGPAREPSVQNYLDQKVNAALRALPTGLSDEEVGFLRRCLLSELREDWALRAWVGRALSEEPVVDQDAGQE
ncbi:MAG TPA: hypothetical protein VFQ61_18100 [Polyangiaceae bacterium]|nr:hypothetical protein [Polyangiaceae bacterium]